MNNKVMEDIFGADILENGSKKIKKKKTFSMTFYEEDFEKWKEIQDYVIFEERRRDYSFSDMVREGIELLREKYGELPYRNESFVKTGGRRRKDFKVETSSAFITIEDFNYYQDFLYYQVYEKRNREYYTYDFTREIVSLLQDKYNINPS